MIPQRTRRPLNYSQIHERLFVGKTKRYAIAGADLKAVYTACCAIAALYMTNTGFRPAEIGDDGIGACAGPRRPADVPSSR